MQSESLTATNAQALQTALELQRSGRLAEAEKLCWQMLESEPGNSRALNLLGSIANQVGKPQIAAELIARALSFDRNFAEAHNNLGNALKEQGQPARAMASYQQALSCKPDYAEAHYNLGNTLKELGRLDEAVASLRKAIQFKPALAEAHNNLGRMLQELGNTEEALACYHKALSFKSNLPEARINLGNAFREQGRLDEAVASYQAVLSFNPHIAEAHCNLGLALQESGKLAEAEASYRKALAIRRNYAEAHYNLGNALGEMGRLDEAVASYQQAIACKPDDAAAHNNLGNAHKAQGRLDLALASYRQALSIDPDYAEAHSNLLFALQFLPEASPLERVAESRRYAARFEAPWQSQWRPHRNSPEPERRLRIGYVSPDFRRHAVAHFIKPVLARHDRSAVEIFCYYNAQRKDDFTTRLAAHADHWLACKALTDEQLAARIGADGIDILVDLAGHTANNRLPLFSRKPAPVQITYLGYPGTSGLSAMDYRITDGHADSRGSEERYTETLLRLPHSLWCYRPIAGMPEVLPLPALRRGYLTFGSFNNFNKQDPSTIDLWAALLRALPDARLLMVTVPEGEARTRLSEQFAKQGVAAERLEFHGKLPSAEFHRLLSQVDMALDPVNVNGATTTCESLWLGVPTLSLKGNSFLSRAGWSILSAAGVPEFAADNTQDYIKIATRLAADLPALARIRAGLRTRLAASPLMDETGFTRDLERIYRDVWTKWCVSMNKVPGTPLPGTP